MFLARNFALVIEVPNNLRSVHKQPKYSPKSVSIGSENAANVENEFTPTSFGKNFQFPNKPTKSDGKFHAESESVKHFKFTQLVLKLRTKITIDFSQTRRASDAQQTAYSCQRPHHVEHTGSRQLPEVKLRRARSVRRWVTASEYLVPLAAHSQNFAVGNGKISDGNSPRVSGI